MALQPSQEPDFEDCSSDAAILTKCLKTGALEVTDRKLDNDERQSIVAFIRKAGAQNVLRVIPHNNFQAELKRTAAPTGFAALLKKESPIALTSDICRQRSIYEVINPPRDMMTRAGFRPESLNGTPVSMSRDTIVKLLPGNVLPELPSETQVDFVARVVNEESKFPSKLVKEVTGEQDNAIFRASLEGDGHVFPLYHLDTYSRAEHFYIGVETGVPSYAEAAFEVAREKGITLGEFVQSTCFRQLNTLSNANADAIAARVAKALGVEIAHHTEYSDHNCMLNMSGEEKYGKPYLRSYLSNAQVVSQPGVYNGDAVAIFEGAGNTMCPYSRFGFVYSMGMPNEMKIMHPRTQKEQEGTTLVSSSSSEKKWTNSFLNSFPVSEPLTHDIKCSVLSNNKLEMERYQNCVAWDPNMADVNLNLLYPHKRTQDNIHVMFSKLGFENNWHIITAMSAFYRIGQTDMKLLDLETIMNTSARTMNNYYFNTRFSDAILRELENESDNQVDSIAEIINTDAVPEWRMVPVGSDVTHLITLHWPELQALLSSTLESSVSLPSMFVEISPSYLKMDIEVLGCLDQIVTEKSQGKRSTKASMCQMVDKCFKELSASDQKKNVGN